MQKVEQLQIEDLIQTTVDIDDFEFADGGRVPYMAGMLG